MYCFLCRYLVIHLSFLRGSVFCYNTMCSFSHHDAIPSINLFFFSVWQRCCVTASSISLWDQRNSLSLYPEDFSQRCFTTAAEASVSKHRLPSALWRADWIIHSHPPRQYRQRVSVCLVWWPQSNILLLSACFFFYGIDDWHDVSLKAWSLF